MKVDDTVLMAYVDDELSPQERQEIEDELRAHAELADKVALFQASRLPYREAFAEQKLPPVPASLARRVDDLIRAHTPRRPNRQWPPPLRKATTRKAQTTPRSNTTRKCRLPRPCARACVSRR